MSMLSLTATWVDKHFQRQQVLLHCQEMTGSHTAVNIAKTFDTVLQRWCLDKNRIHVVLCDNGRNISKVLDERNLPSLPCIAHTLQLIVNEGLLSQRSITDVVATARKIVGHFKHSTLVYSQLHDIQAQLGQPSKRHILYATVTGGTETCFGGIHCGTRSASHTQHASVGGLLRTV